MPQVLRSDLTFESRFRCLSSSLQTINLDTPDEKLPEKPNLRSKRGVRIIVAAIYSTEEARRYRRMCIEVVLIDSRGEW